MAHEKLKPTYTFDQDRLDALKKIVPEAFADGRINWESLREALGDYLETDGPDEEHFGLFWPGKRQARRLASLPSTGTLTPVYGEGLRADGTPDADGQNDSRNVFIEGENLEVLKILQKAYAGRIKMIYIDPPYNTGNDFVYDDDFTEPLQEYLRRTGQVDEEGKPLTTNKKADGRFHSKWLSMMYPRLRLARNLLREDGVIFVSIDDNEVHHLRLLMNEVFGEENFVGTIIWKSRKSEDTRAKNGLSNDHEYLLVYTSSSSGRLKGELKDQSKFSNPDGDPRGPWRSADLTGLATADRRPNLHYDLVDPNTQINYGCPPKGWRYSPETMNKKIEESRILWPSTENGRPRHKLFLNEMDSIYKNMSSVIVDVGTSQGTQEVNKLVGDGVFQFPKPSKFIKKIIEQTTDEGDLILDFFAGSGTTGHSIFEQNISDESNRKFILVQLPEQIEESSAAGKAGFNDIAAITRERLRSVVDSIIPNQNIPGIDFGFKTFCLQKSHYKSWQNYTGQSVSQLEDLFSRFEDPLVEGWTADGLLTEILLLEGFPLDSRIEAFSAYTANQIKKVSSDFHRHALLVCLDEQIEEVTIQQLDLGDNDVFICLDRAILDREKLRLSDKGLIKTI